MKTIKHIVFLGALIIITQASCVHKTNNKVNSENITYKINRKSEMTAIHPKTPTAQCIQSYNSINGTVKTPIILLENESKLGELVWTDTTRASKIINNKPAIKTITISRNSLNINKFNIVKANTKNTNCIVSSTTLSEVLRISNENDSLKFNVEGIHHDTISFPITDQKTALLAGKQIFYRKATLQIKEEIKRINEKMN